MNFKQFLLQEVKIVGSSLDKALAALIQGALRKLPPGELRFIKGIEILPQDEFLALPGINPRDKAYFDVRSGKIVINAFDMHFAVSPRFVIVHEVGHSLEPLYLEPNIDEFDDIRYLYELQYKHPSEVFADFYAHYRTKEKWVKTHYPYFHDFFKRILEK